MNVNRRIRKDLIQGQLFMLLLVFLFITHYANAAIPVKSDETSALQIRMETTRPQPSAGVTFGVATEIANISKSTTLYLTGLDVRLVLPPEVDPWQQQGSWYAYFPTEADQPSGAYKSLLMLKPGEKYKIFFALTKGKDEKPRGWLSARLKQWIPFIATWVEGVSSQMEFVFFAPGEYKVSIVAKYWTDPGRPANDYHTTFQTVMVNIVAPEFVILFGAAVGGLIAYFILPHARQRFIRTRGDSIGKSQHSFFGRAGTEFLGIFGAVVLSMMITILLSRMSEAQFFIRVTVTDLWGGIAIGFATNYAGSAVLTRLFGKIPDDEKKELTEKKVEDGATGKQKTESQL